MDDTEYEVYIDGDLSVDYSIVKKIKKAKLSKLISRSFLLYGIVPSISTMFLLIITTICTPLLNFSDKSIMPIYWSFYWFYRLLSSLREKYDKKTERALEDIKDDILDLFDENMYITDFSDIKIIPKNVQVGEDLFKKNVIPIYEKANFILVKNHYSPKRILINEFTEPVDGKKIIVIDDEEVIDDLIKTDKPKLLIKKREE